MNTTMEKRTINGVELEIGPGVNLAGANLSWTNLSKANLSGANLYKANLSMADLSMANLTGANLSWANLSWTNLSGAYLYDANLSNANLSGVKLSLARGIISFGPVGNDRRIGYVVANEKTGPMVQLGCFWGTLKEARKAIQGKYGENSTYENFMLAAADELNNQH